MEPLEAAAADHDILEAGQDMGYLSAAQVEVALKRLDAFRRGGVRVGAGMVLLERHYLTPAQLKHVMAELTERRQAEGPGAKPKAQTPPRALGKYEVLEVLSEKGRARVFKARDTRMNRLVVLKVLPKNLAEDPVWSERFKREVQLSGQLSHANIVTTYGSGEEGGCPLLAFEYLDGMSLGERLEREGNVPEKTTWQIAREVAKGLGYASAKGVLHRDIKPENIFCTNDGLVKIIDMGLGKSMVEDVLLTAAGTTVGTPFYISPEQAHGTKNLDARSDIYSLGCTVFHMLTGSIPFIAEALTDIMVKHTEAPRPDPRSLLPEISEGSAKLVMRMMALQPGDRPQSAIELAMEIDALLPALPEPETLVRPPHRVLKSGPEMPELETAQTPPDRRKPHKPSLLIRFSDWLAKLFD